MTKDTKAWLALLFISITWGTTYLAIRVGAMHFPAFLFAAIRQVIAGVIIIIMALLVNKNYDLSWKNLRHNMFIGFLLITMGNGIVTWSERNIPSGIAALICSLMPLFAVMINLAKNQKEKLNAPIIFGLLLGFAGVAFIFKDDLSKLGNPNYLWSAAGIFLATFCWALGSVFNKRKAPPVNALFNSGTQLFFGGSFLFIASPAVDNYAGMNLLQPEVLWSLVYLIVFGSVLAYTAYMYALSQLPVGVVTLYAYVNPLVAVVLGYYMLAEPLTIFTALAFLSIVSGVYLVNFGYKRQLLPR